METQSDKFLRLAESRVTKAIKCIRLIGNLANKHNYDYTSKEAEKIVDALESELKSLKHRFQGAGQNNDVKFKF